MPRYLLNTILLLTAFLAPRAHADPPRAADNPNILLIVADDLGWGDVGWHGGYGRTPCLDRLVREGVELDQHYVQPVCTPTRTALLSGRYPGRFGPHALAPSNLRAMPLGTITLATALRSQGYTTYQAGKWHLGARPEWGPNHYGFDHSYGTLTGAADPWTHKYRRDHYEDTWHRDGVRLDEPGNATDLVAAEVVRRIEERAAPWFLCVGFHAVHTPVDAPDEYKRLYDGVKFDDDPVRHDSRLRMAAMIAQLDAKVADFVAALERTGQRERTLIVFTSDNGGIESLKNAYVGDVPDSPLNSENAPLRGEKNTLHEGGIRVCAFAHWPARLAPRKHVAPLHAVDWFPTLAHLTGYQPPRDLKWDGQNQWPALQGQGRAGDGTAGGEPATDLAPRTIYIAMQNGDAMLRRGDWKLILAKKRPPQLFDLARDPYETDNLADNEPALVRQLTEQLNEQRALDQPELPADLVGLPK